MDLWIQILYINALKYQPDIKYLKGMFLKPYPFIYKTIIPQSDSVQKLIHKIHTSKQK